MKPIAGNIHVAKRFSLIKNKQNSLDTTAHTRTDAAGIPLLIEAFQTSVSNTLDHGSVYHVRLRITK
jgi:hypothetical protein